MKSLFLLKQTVIGYIFQVHSIGLILVELSTH